MAIHQHYPQSQSSSFLLDALYCEETEHWAEEEEEVEVGEREFVERERNDEYSFSSTYNTHNCAIKSQSLVLLDQDLAWEDEELLSLFTKEKQLVSFLTQQNADPCVLLARKEAVDWILKVKAHYGFSALTAILAINYIDRFLSSLHFQNDKPWMIQILAVTCLSLAAKVEETHVPLLLDLQVDTKYLFEAKTIQKMELLVMSTLQWRMNPVTPISFLDHITRRLGLKSHLHWEFFKRCEALILSLVSDSRFVRFLPSALATATMLHVIDQVETSNPFEYQNQLLGVLKTTKEEEVKECYELIVGVSPKEAGLNNNKNNPLKRKCGGGYEEEEIFTCSSGPESPSGVMDACFSSSDSSNDSWALGPPTVSSSNASSPHHHHQQQQQHLLKKMRLAVAQEQLGLASSLGSNSSSSSSRVLVDVISSPH